MSIRDNPPRIIQTEQQLQYYCDIFDELSTNEVQLQTQDRYPLAVMAINMSIIEEAAISIGKDGMTIEVQGDRNVVTKPNPAVAALKDAQNTVRALFKEFRMTPASRPKGGLTGSGKDGDADGWNAFTENTQDKGKS